MLTVYLCFFAGGLVLPFVSFLTGFLSDGMDTDTGMDADSDIDVSHDVSVDTATAADAGTNMTVGTESLFSIGLLPTSLLSISALAIFFGATGALMTFAHRGKLLTFLLAVIFGYLACVVVQTMIKSLKKVQRGNSGIDENELLLYDGKIVDTVLPGQLGSVSFITLKNQRVSYPARCGDDSLTLKSGRIVRAKEFRDGVFIVEPKNKYE